MKKFQYKKILIIKHGSLGDVLNSTSVIKAIYDKHHSSEIIILTTSAYSSFFKKFNKNFKIFIIIYSLGYTQKQKLIAHIFFQIIDTNIVNLIHHQSFKV